jgi:hypothetical protein
VVTARSGRDDERKENVEGMCACLSRRRRKPSFDDDGFGTMTTFALVRIGRETDGNEHLPWVGSYYLSEARKEGHWADAPRVKA